MIQPHSSWSLLDPSKLSDMQRCPRYFFYRHILGWEYDRPNLDLVFGEAWHLAKESILLYGLSDDSLTLANGLFTQKYRESFPEANDLDNYPKNPGGAAESLQTYRSTYRDCMNFHLVDLNGAPATERYGTVPIGEGRVLHFRIDAIGEVENSAIAFLDHKTTGRDSAAYQAAYTLTMQMLTYLHAINCLFEGRVYGGIVDLSIFRKPDKKGNSNMSHMRIPIRKTIEAMSEWLYIANSWYDQVESNIEDMLKCKPEDRIMSAWARNERGCTAYNRRCRYYDFCISWSNPLAKCSSPPEGFIEEHWDPGKKEEEAKKINKFTEVQYDM